jgi:hypothetical protein
VHELGHLAHWSVSRNRWGESWPAGASGAEQRALAQQVSRYAASDPGEFVAEIFAGTRLGRVYSADIMALYQWYGGWKP